MESDFEKQVAETTRHAIASGALASLPSECLYTENQGIPFVVHLLGNLPARSAAIHDQLPDFDPFLPWEQDLYVCDLGPSHVCLLNKFTVVPHHVLIVTRAFEEQESVLNQADLAALCVCLEGMDGVGFYNSGKVAGASQRHKHLQLAPLVEVPVEKALAEAVPAEGGFEKLPLFPFPHLLQRNPDLRPAILLSVYQKMLQILAIEGQGGLHPYNLLLTRRWFMVVPRCRERWDEIAVNALGFTGNLVARNVERYHRIVQNGPIEILSRVVKG